jgi:hypothetical protein
MSYTLITPMGKVYTFYLPAMAEMYQQAYGGTLIIPEQFERVLEQDLTSCSNGIIIST